MPGGTYVLVDPLTSRVVYVGRTKDLDRRAAEHRRSPATGGYRFEIDWITDDYAVLRGREQILYDLHKPILNRSQPISPNHPERQAYLDAARAFEARLQGKEQQA